MSLQVWLPLNGDLKNQGLSAVEVTNTGATVAAAGKIGQCYQFGPTAKQYLTISKEAMTSFTTEASVCFWFKVIAWNTSYATFFQAGLGSAAWTHYIFGFLRNNAASTCCFTVSNGSSASNAFYLTPAFDLDKWYHVALVYKTGHCLIYINGELYRDYTTSIVPNFAGITTITTGICNNKSSYQTNCQMNDLRIYDHALSVKEVEELARGLVLHYKLDDEYIEDTTNLVTKLNMNTSTDAVWGGHSRTVTNYDCTNEPVPFNSGSKIEITYPVNNTTGGGVSVRLGTPFSVKASTVYTISTYLKATDNFAYTHQNFIYYYGDTGGKGVFTSSKMKSVGNGWYRIWNTITTGSNQTSMDPYFYSYPSKNVTYYIGGWQVEEKDHLTPYTLPNTIRENEPIYDSSGYGHHANLIGEITITNSTPRYNVATHLDSSSPTTSNSTGLSYLQSSFGLTTPTQMTVCWWGKPESGYTGTSGHAAWCTSISSSAPTDYNSTAFHHRDSGFDICQDGQSPKRLTFNNYTLNEWHYYCVVYDGKIAILYKDGVESNRLTLSSTEAPLKTFTNLYIGYSRAGGVWRKTLGSYSDFRIYATALTPAAIEELYHTSASIDNKYNGYARAIQEGNQNNLMQKINMNLANNDFDGSIGLGSYSQKNCIVTVEDNSIHIYRPANLTTANDGNTMYGGVKLTNSSNGSIHQYDSSVDNIFNLQEGHTYIWIFHVSGHTTQAPSFQISNNMGWGGHGLSPTPSGVVAKNITTNFSGSQDVYYKFTINDEIVKTCTSSYSSFVVDKEYLSYKHFGWNWSYGSTGDGTDIYVTNIRLYDITNIDELAQITKQGIMNFTSFYELDNLAKVLTTKDFEANQFYEY